MGQGQIQPVVMASVNASMDTFTRMDYVGHVITINHKYFKSMFSISNSIVSIPM